jgi:phage terminase large subunit-like protein
LILDGWQADAVRDLLVVKADGETWAARNGVLVCPRQNGKGAILEAIVLADMFLFGQQLVIWTAHEFSTANEAFLRVRNHIQRNDWMESLIDRITTANGNVGIELTTGQRLLFKARSAGSQRGFSADRLIYDEAYNLADATLEASLPSMSARPNAQTLFTSSAPTDRPESQVLRRLMRRGRRTPKVKSGPVPAKDPRLAYLEFSADPSADLDDPNAWRQANPGMTSRRAVPTLETVADERASMTDAGFARERLGIIEDAHGASVIDLDLWDELADEDSTPLDGVVFAVDVAPDQSFTSISLAGVRADGLVHAEVADRRKGTGWVADRLAELQSNWSPQSIVLDPIGQSAALVPALDAAGVQYRLIGTRDVTAGCAFFYSSVSERRLRYFPQPGLRAAIEAASKRKVGEDGWAWNRRDTTDISPLVSLTNAVYAQAVASGRAADPAADSRMFFFSR